jgi:DNA-binding CsgD family transcriptional regulator
VKNLGCESGVSLSFGPAVRSLAVDSPTRETSRVEHALLGRQRELTDADAFLDAMQLGLAAFVVEGEPGIGKTALWRETLRKAAARSYGAICARPAESEAGLTFVALADLFGNVGSEVVSDLPEPQRRALDAALLRGDGAETHDRRAVATALVSVLTYLSGSSPVVVAVDDVQWLDRPTASALEFAARRLEGHRVGFLLSARTQGRSAVPLALEQALTDDRLRRLRLGPLGLGSLHRLIHSRLGRALPRSALVRVERVSGGNPFFALEIARVLLRDGIPPIGEPLPVPEDVVELVTQRVARLPPETHSALLTASALAQPRSELLGDALAPAVDAEIVRREAGGAVAFTHPLFASAVYAAASPDERRAVHGRLAGVVEDLEQRAHHLALATNEPDGEVAATLEQAGVEARRRGAPETAAELFERACSATPLDRPEDRWRRELLAAEHHFHAGDRERARTLVETLIAAAPRGPLRAEALRLLGQERYHDNDLAGAVELFEQALENADGDPALCAPTELHLSFVMVLTGDLIAAVRHAHAALQHAQAVDDDGLRAEALGVTTICDFIAGHAPADDMIEEALLLEDPLRTTFVQLRPTSVAGLFFMWTGRLERARTLLRLLRSRMLEAGEESDLPMGTFHLTWVECWRGDLPAAAALAEEALAVTEQVGGEATRALALLAQALPRSFTGDAEGARANVEASLEICERIGWRYAIAWGLTILGFVALSVGDASEVDRTLQPLVELAEELGIGEPMTAPFLPDEVEALVALGQLDRAEALLDPFHRRAVELDRPWALATSLRCRGLIAAGRGELDTAIRVLDDAVVVHEQLGMPFELGRTLLVLGQVRRRKRAKRTAATALERAVEIFEQVGARLWADKARSELERCGLRRVKPDELTPTERRVAELAASGSTNREIADAIFISPKTVEANLARVYRKLEIRSRAELGAWLERERATEAQM